MALSSLKRAMDCHRAALSAVLQPISPPGEGRKGEFAMSMALCNFASVSALFLWAASVISTDAEVVCETIIFLLKWSAEVVYDDFKIDSYDLWVHHLVYLSGLGMAVVMPTAQEKEAAMSTILSLTSIHIPLLFHWVRRVAHMRGWTTLARTSDKMFLVLWPATIFFRAWVSLRVFLPSTPPDLAWLAPLKSRFMLLFIPPLDLLWTPWRRWRDCLVGKPSTA